MEEFKQVTNNEVEELGKIFEKFFKNNKISKDSIETYKITKQEAKEGTEKDIKISTADICEECKGIKNTNQKCPKCYGYGYYFNEKTMHINIPAKIKNNDCLVYKGEGNQLKVDEERGDLYINIHIYGNKGNRKGKKINYISN